MSNLGFAKIRIPTPLLLTSLLVLATVALYSSALRDWALQLWKDPSYSHGILVPFISGYLVYRSLTKANLPKILDRIRTDWSGYVVLLFGLFLLVAGEGAGLNFLVHLSFLVVLGGIVLALLGRRVMREWAFPYGFLFFALPLPALIYLPFAFHLQLLSSAIAGHALDLLSIPALREGNIIILPNVSLEVVEACSGVHSLLALLAVATLAAYLFVDGLGYGGLLLLSAPPLAVLLNSIRITLLGVLSYEISPASAEGLAHSSTGMVLFGIGSAIILWFAARLGRRRSPHTGEMAVPPVGGPATAVGVSANVAAGAARAAAPPVRAMPMGGSFMLHGCVVAAILTVGWLAYVHARHPATQLPAQRPWADFPSTIAGWQGRDLGISRAQLDSLGTDSVLLREYQRADGPPVTIYVAYFPAQHEGTTMHSPLHCIPGAGWEAERQTLLPVQIGDTDPFRVNEVVFRKGTSEVLVLYWYLQQGRVEISELRGALRTFWDSLASGRTDGCLIRISSPIVTTGQADLQHQLAFLHQVLPLLTERFLPSPPSPPQLRRFALTSGTIK